MASDRSRAPGSFYRLIERYLADVDPGKDPETRAAQAMEIVDEVRKATGHPRRPALLLEAEFDPDNAYWVTASGRGVGVQLAYNNDLIGMRNSTDPDGPLLVFTKEHWGHFVQGVERGDFSEIPPEWSASGALQAEQFRDVVERLRELANA